FVEPEDSAQAFETGSEVEWQWTQYEKSLPERFPELMAFFDVARRTPKLRQLFPFTSLNRLCFSRCTGYPYTDDCPAVVPKWGRGSRDIIPNCYTVELGNREIGEGDGAEAVRIVVANLPPNCGPAVAGTADDLAGEH
ncbi:MAG TPA: DUF6193 family natural product biosynthesis protein, partial [Planctomycetaceae bacterium]|nr:DUF6193 family natural product biosynthesis protein [Planctomycetaceae bacterium]